MSEFFQNKFRVPTTRLQHWNYSWPGLYYVTICTKDRICRLAEIKNDNVYLFELGNVVFECWLNITKHFNNAILDDFIIMPNHLHGIIALKENNDFDKDCRDAPWRVSTGNKFGPLQSKSLPSIMNHFKGAVKRHCNKNDLTGFQWQARYYEYIIRNEEDFARVKKYIANNPVNRAVDRNNPLNIKK